MAKRLAAVTGEFYAAEAASFSKPHQNSWEGWKKIVELLAVEGRHELRVTDIASGNLRFGRFLAQILPDVRIAYEAIDSCRPLIDEERLPQNILAHCYVHDIVDGLLNEGDMLPQRLAPADLVACFGFLHHVPGGEPRLHLVQKLVDAAAPGGHHRACPLAFRRRSGKR
ncbi:class I SAM-dependent methyltransferase [Atopobium sp. oral taxon 416]|uniref:class I SAM-dependent methyltransferase n=1 Tax=Atopobium sp. oral taxon 416 TaxID=712157 RepID=UPI001BAA9AEF|nr:class I SAM-dependent methyltransferase [Atopobium sp. oral taxon 416]QUC02912.1 class I SAM-dependent methyltransferase [Atopobium sp. oral taxon 416]